MTIPNGGSTSPAIGRHIQVGGLKLWVLEAGEGNPLVLLHGLPGSSEAWRQVLAPLAAGHRVIAPDLPGCGRSDKPHTGYEVGRLAGHMLDLLDALGLEQVNLVGHSLGGHVALTMALDQPERVRSLALVDARGLGQEVHFHAMEPLLEEVNEVSVREFLSTAFSDPERIQAWMVEQIRAELSDPAAHAALYVMVRSEGGPDGQRHSIPERMAELRMPTLIVWGDQDALLPCHQGQEAAAQVAKGRYIGIPSCGHYPHLEQAGAFVSALTALLNERRD